MAGDRKYTGSIAGRWRHDRFSTLSLFLFLFFFLFVVGRKYGDIAFDVMVLMVPW